MHRKCIITSPKKRNFSLNDNICVFSYKGQQLLNLIKDFSKISWICCKIYSLKLISQKLVYDAHGFWINWKKLFFEFEKRGDKRVIFKSMTWIWQFRFFLVILHTLTILKMYISIPLKLLPSKTQILSKCFQTSVLIMSSCMLNRKKS